MSHNHYESIPAMYSMRSLVSRSVLALLLLSTVLGTASAQDVSYKTKSKTELHVLGFLGGLFNGETKQDVAIKGYKMRADEKDHSTITDLDGERFIQVNHKKKEYSVVTFAQMAEMMSSLGTKMNDAEKPQMAEGDKPDYDVEFNLDVKNTGKTQKIDGYKTEEKVLILETRFKPKDASADSLPSGSIYAVTDMWLAGDIPEMGPAEAFQKRAAEVMQSNLESMDMAGVINQLLGSYPQVGAAMDRAKEEMTKVEGFPMVTTMHLVTVPSDKDLDLELALGEKKEEKKKGGGFGGFLKKMAEAQGVPAGGDEKAEAKQKTLLSVYSSTSDISNKSREASYFEPPSGYKEVEYQSPMKDMEKN